MNNGCANEIKTPGQQRVEAATGWPIRTLLEQLRSEGYTQAQIAARFGVHRITLHRWLRDLGIR